MIISLLVMIFVSPNLILSAMIDTSKNCVSLCLDLLAIYAVWLGILEIVDKSGISEKIAKLLHKPIKRIFKLENFEQIKYVSINLSCNLLGLGNASTPSGIKAIKLMENDLPKTRFAMIMLLVVNATGLQLFPTTVIGLRAGAGSKLASDIILPTFLATIIPTVLCALTLHLFSFLKGKKKYEWPYYSNITTSFNFVCNHKKSQCV